MAHYRWLLRTVIPNLRGLRGYWRDFCYGLYNMRTFGYVIWTYRTFDWTYMVRVLEVMTGRMAKTLAGDEYHLNTSRHARRLAVMNELCRRIAEEDYGKRYKDFMRGEAMHDRDVNRLARHMRYLRCWWV